MKHTPGPWEVTIEDHRMKVHPAGWRNSVIVEWREGRTGASRGQRRQWTGNYPPYAQANARLIAAAPDLLEALIAVKSILTSDNYVIHKANGDDVSVAEIGVFIDVFERADAAIAKAGAAP